MRRMAAILTVLGILAALAMVVSAATGASAVDSFAGVSADGGCQVSMTVTLHLEQAVESLVFPVPADATGVTLNGSRVSAVKEGTVRNISLSKVTKNVVGDVTVNITYSLYDVIHTTEEGTMELRLPLLSGFAYPVETMRFSVTMPGQLDVLPAFESGYHQARIEEYLTYTVEGATVTGSALQAMKDHETLTMTMAVTEEMFPRTIAQTRDYQWGVVAMELCAALAGLYWLIALRNLPVRRREAAEPPQGFHAGQIGCIATGRGVDLTLTVFTWAQLGYLLIQIDRHNRVLLHKRMDMGNERSQAEQRIFQKLFGKRTLVDTTGYAYAALCRMVAKQPMGIRELMHPHTGSPYVFRTLAAGIGLFGGVCLAIALAGGAALQGFLIVLLGIAGGISGWLIQSAGVGMVLRDGKKLLPGLLLGVVWMLLWLAAGAFTLGLWMVLGLLLAGLLYAWGGRRTDLGRQTLAQVLGLRKYLHSADTQALKRLTQSDPEYFFRLAPYAMALGADRVFAKRFGKERLERCPYLTTGMDAHMTALQWSVLLRSAADSMNDRARRLPFEKLLDILRSITRP